MQGLTDKLASALERLDKVMSAWWKIPSIDNWYLDGKDRTDLDVLQDEWAETLETAIEAVKSTIKGENDAKK